MKTTLFASAAALALTAGMAPAQDLMFTPGEGAFNWDSLEPSPPSMTCRVRP